MGVGKLRKSCDGEEEERRKGEGEEKQGERGENRRGGRGVKKPISLLCVFYAIVWCSISGQPMSFGMEMCFNSTQHCVVVQCATMCSLLVWVKLFVQYESAHLNYV